MRNKGIDIMRALTMVLMITVNDFWTVDGIPHWMHHAQGGEDMLGLSDIVFPLFLLAMGMSIPYAVSHKLEHSASEKEVVGHIFSRSLILLLMGAFICNSEYGIDPSIGYGHAAYSLMMVAGFFLLWNNYPSGINPWIVRGGKLAGALLLAFLLVTSRNPEGNPFSAHWWGILGLIGWTYLVCGTIYYLFRDSKMALMGFWIAFLVLNALLTPMNPEHENAVLLQAGGTQFLRQCLGILHMDNCGLCALGMGGVVLSAVTREWVGDINRKRAVCLLTLATILCVGALASHRFFIISKLQASLPWVLAITSLGTAMYLAFSLMCQKGWEAWTRLIRPAGTATLTCYMIPYIMYALMDICHFSWPQWTLAYPIGLGKCLFFSLLCVFVTYLLGKGKIKLKI